MFLLYLYRIGGELSDEGKHVFSNNFIALAKDLFEDKYPDRLTSDLLYCDMLFSLGDNYAILYDAMSLDNIINLLGKFEFTSFEDTERYKNLMKTYESIMSLYLEGLEEQDVDIEVSIADNPVTKPIVESAELPTLPAVEQKNELMNMMPIGVVVLTFGIGTSLLYILTKRKKIHNT